MMARAAEGLQAPADEDEGEDDNDDEGPNIVVNTNEDQEVILQEGPRRMTTRSMALQAGSSCINNEE